MAPIVLPTNDLLAIASTKDLIALYNILTPNAQVKKFVDRKTALARTVKVVEAARATREIEEQMAAAAKAEKVGAGDLPASPKKAKAAKEPKPARKSLCGELRELIFAGKTNAEIVDILKLVGKKKTYPGWVRTKLVRDGKLAPTK